MHDFKLLKRVFIVLPKVLNVGQVLLFQGLELGVGLVELCLKLLYVLWCEGANVLNCR